MVTINAFRAAIGKFDGCMRKIVLKNKLDLNISCECFTKTYVKYISLCIVRKYMPSLLKIFDLIYMRSQSHHILMNFLLSPEVFLNIMNNISSYESVNGEEEFNMGDLQAWLKKLMQVQQKYLD